jgi:hypothetical protein
MLNRQKYVNSANCTIKSGKSSQLRDSPQKQCIKCIVLAFQPTPKNNSVQNTMFERSTRSSEYKTTNGAKKGAIPEAILHGFWHNP